MKLDEGWNIEALKFGRSHAWMFIDFERRNSEAFTYQRSQIGI